MAHLAAIQPFVILAQTATAPGLFLATDHSLGHTYIHAQSLSSSYSWMLPCRCVPRWGADDHCYSFANSLAIREPCRQELSCIWQQYRWTVVLIYSVTIQKSSETTRANFTRNATACTYNRVEQCLVQWYHHHRPDLQWKYGTMLGPNHTSSWKFHGLLAVGTKLNHSKCVLRDRRCQRIQSTLLRDSQLQNY